MKYWKAIKLNVKVFIRFSRDIRSRDWFKFSRELDDETSFEHFLSLSQEIKQNETYESKLYNFSIASQKINRYIIKPNAIFSFWRIIGNPDNQFRKGRTIQNGKIIEDVGGGLCQISGVIYYISLVAGLKILERHNHSVDIYNDETRFCPLGTDATVVYGYKDLRILNSNSYPIKFELEIKDKLIVIKLLSTGELVKNNLEFKIEKQNEHTLVETYNSSKKVLNTSKYKNFR